MARDPQPDDADALVREARGFVGGPAGKPRTAPYPVNEAMIVHWTGAFGDANPVYTDPEVAAATRHGGVVAPPQMLGTWTMDVSSGRSGSGRDEVLGRLDRAGYTAVVATNYAHEYLRELRPGDVLSESIAVEELSERKRTGLGEGYFVTVRHDYRDQDGELVGVARMKLLKFEPRPRRPVGPRPRPAVNRDNAFFWEAAAQRRLVVQRCQDCGALRHPPRPMCGQCRSTAWDTIEASGRGTVHSFAIHHHPPLPGIELPLAVVLVDLEEGVRIVSHLTGADPADVHVGQALELVWEAVDDELVLPLFRPVDDGLTDEEGGS